MSVHIDPKNWTGPSDYVKPVAKRKKCRKCGKKIRGANHDAHCQK